MTPTAQPILELRGVNKSFGVVHVLHDVDFQVYPGEVTALVGDNGAGKSTLVKAIAGITARCLSSCDRSLLKSEYPSSPGILMSVKTICGAWSLIASKA